MWLHKHLTTIWTEYLANEDHAWTIRYNGTSLAKVLTRLWPVNPFKSSPWYWQLSSHSFHHWIWSTQFGRFHRIIEWTESRMPLSSFSQCLLGALKFCLELLLIRLGYNEYTLYPREMWMCGSRLHAMRLLCLTIIYTNSPYFPLIFKVVMEVKPWLGRTFNKRMSEFSLFIWGHREERHL